MYSCRLNSVMLAHFGQEWRCCLLPAWRAAFTRSVRLGCGPCSGPWGFVSVTTWDTFWKALHDMFNRVFDEAFQTFWNERGLDIRWLPSHFHRCVCWYMLWSLFQVIYRGLKATLDNMMWNDWFLAHHAESQVSQDTRTMDASDVEQRAQSDGTSAADAQVGLSTFAKTECKDCWLLDISC